MANKDSTPCALFGKWNKCLGDAPGTELCHTCPKVHPAAAYLWRRDNPGFNDLFKEIDARNENPRTCVTRRARYADSQMTAAVLDSWKRYGDLSSPENPGVFHCDPIGKDAKDDTVCGLCLEVMTNCGREGWFNEDDNTVNEDKILESSKRQK